MRWYRKVRKKAKIRNPHNQVPHLTQDTTLESDKITRNHHTQESQEFSPFPTGDHKAAMNKTAWQTRNISNKMIHKSCICSKNRTIRICNTI